MGGTCRFGINCRLKFCEHEKVHFMSLCVIAVSDGRSDLDHQLWHLIS